MGKQKKTILVKKMMKMKLIYVITKMIYNHIIKNQMKVEDHEKDKLFIVHITTNNQSKSNKTQTKELFAKKTKKGLKIQMKIIIERFDNYKNTRS